VQPANGHIVEPAEWPVAAPTLVIPAIRSLDNYEVAEAATPEPFGAEFRPPPVTTEQIPQATGSDAQLGEIMVQVQQFATEARENAQREAQAIVEAARAEAWRIVGEAHQQAAQTPLPITDSAQADAQRIIAEAEQQAVLQSQQLIDAARSEARRIIEDAHRQAAESAPAITESARAEAQRMIEQAKQQATLHARDIVESGRAEAHRIVEEATRVSSQRTSSGPLAVSPDAVGNLSASITEFAESNRVLIDQLIALRDSLASSPAPTPSAQPLEAPPGHDQLFADLQALGSPSL
jgi:cell division septum initiation protein DivIVA